MIKNESEIIKMNIALLTAAGVGSRMGQDIPKQFIHVNNKPLIIYTLEAFEKHPNIDAIIVVTLPSWIDVLKAYAKQFNITKLKWIIPGGEDGQESIYNGIKEIEKHCSGDDVVMIHDGNRCLVSSEIISSNLATFKKYGDAVTAIPVVEVVFQSEKGDVSKDVLDRDKLWRTQTPHTYTLKKLLWAHNEAKVRNLKRTAATCELMALLGEDVHFSKGSEENLKITTTDDMKIFSALLNVKQEGWLK
ncbi:IspD/TarI family cytidylyltransferase [Ligilactobacillus agilis]|uniref:IspD/TarI family cytidylyltransferase n=2 Tax=Ligilactobacillus agilis TaxID=1601 RepID=UPI001CDD5E95|nr:IspD/TarI family cytidylyltransferase [Ligilactobacillus agilis]